MSFHASNKYFNIGRVQVSPSKEMHLAHLFRHKYCDYRKPQKVILKRIIAVMESEGLTAELVIDRFIQKKVINEKT